MRFTKKISLANLTEEWEIVEYEIKDSINVFKNTSNENVGDFFCPRVKARYHRLLNNKLLEEKEEEIHCPPMYLYRLAEDKARAVDLAISCMLKAQALLSALYWQEHKALLEKMKKEMASAK